MALARVYASRGSVFVENLSRTSLKYEVVDMLDKEGEPAYCDEDELSSGRILQRELVEIARIGREDASDREDAGDAVADTLWVGCSAGAACAACTVQLRPALGTESEPDCEEWTVSLRDGGPLPCIKRARDWRPRPSVAHKLLVNALVLGVGKARDGRGRTSIGRGLRGLPPVPVRSQKSAAAESTPADEEPWELEVFAAVRSCLSPARSGLSIEDVFQRLDRLEVADGGLSRSEFDRMVLTYRSDLSPIQLQRLFARVNTSGSGRISFGEFKARFAAAPGEGGTASSSASKEEPWVREVFSMVKACLSPARSGFSIQEVFQRLDRLESADGTLSRPEFDKMMLTYKPGLLPQELAKLFSLVNTSGSGAVSLAEFAARFGPGPEPAAKTGAEASGSAGPSPASEESEEPWVREVFENVRSCLSPARSGLSVDEVFKRLDSLERADGGLSPAEFDKMILTYRPELSVQQLRRLFAVVNASGSGQITASEFKRRFGEAISQPVVGGGASTSTSTVASPLNKEAGSKSGADPPKEKGKESEKEEAWSSAVLDRVRTCLGTERSGLSIEEVFRRLDRLDKADNTLSPSEFYKMILTYEKGLTAQQLQRLFSLVNYSGSGKITFAEFKRRFGAAVGQPTVGGGSSIATSTAASPSSKEAGSKSGTDPSKVKGKETEKEEAWASTILDKVRTCLGTERSGLSLEEVFRRLDRLDKADNTLSPTEFFKMVLTYEKGLTSQQLQRLFSLVNSSGSGKITFAEFKRRFGAPS